MSIPTRLGVAALVVGLALSLFAQRIVPPILADRVLDVSARTVLGPESTLPAVGSVRLVLGGVVSASVAPEFTRIALIVGARLGRPVEVRRVESDEIAARLLTSGGADFAYVCGGAYVDMRQRARVELLAARATSEGPVARSALIVRSDIGVRSVADLRHIAQLRVAYVDASSATGHDIPRSMLLRAQVPLERSRPVWAGSAERSARLVAAGRADVAGIDRLALERLRVELPDVARRLRVLEVSAPEAGPAFVAAPGLPGALRALLSMAIVGVGSTPEGEAILEDLQIEGFVPVDDSRYDGVRALRRPGEEPR